MRMDNDAHFQRSCIEAGINMVLFGHQHYAYYRPVRSATSGQTPFGPAAPVHFFCCASTLEYSEKDSGFYVYDIATDGVDAYQFSWKGDGFDRTPTVRPLTFR